MGTTAPVKEAEAVEPVVSEEPRKWTVTTAVDAFADTTNAIAGLVDVRDDAKKFLLEHGQKTGRRTFLDRIAMERTGGSLVLDQGAVKDHYAELNLPLPKTRSKLGWTLKLLK